MENATLEKSNVVSPCKPHTAYLLAYKDTEKLEKWNPFLPEQSKMQ